MAHIYQYISSALQQITHEYTKYGHIFLSNLDVSK